MKAICRQGLKAVPRGETRLIPELEDYDVFLETWQPGERLRHASLEQNLADPFVYKRLLDDSTGAAPVERTAFAEGFKAMEAGELLSRAYQFFEDHQAKWAGEFRDYVLDKGVPEAKFDTFVRSVATEWVDGRKRRQDSPEMYAIKVSIRDYDRNRHPAAFGKYVIEEVDDRVPRLFSPEEMAVIFEANGGLIDAFMPDYIDHLDSGSLSSLGDLYVRRGVRMPSIDSVRRELHYLSSYSLAIGPVEQFAQTWTSATRDTGIPSIFSAPIAAVQHRVVAFAPFIADMDLSQLELVVAPPTEETALRDDGSYGGIREFSFL